MSLYVFFGAEAQVWGGGDNETPSISFDHLGQTVEMKDEFAQMLVRRDGLRIMPKEEFDALGFTPEELKSYPNRRLQHAAPADFHGKLVAADAAFKAYRQTLEVSANAHAE